MRYEYSSPLALAQTTTLYGRAVYGKGNNVWYYECSGISPLIKFGISTPAPFILRFYTGDCNLGESMFSISFDGEEFRELTDAELNSAVLRSGIEHDNEQHGKNIRGYLCRREDTLLHST